MPTVAELDAKVRLDTGDLSGKAGEAKRAMRGMADDAEGATGKVGGLSGSIKTGLVAGLVTSLNPIGLATQGIGKMTDFLMDASGAAAAESAQITQLNNTLRTNIAGWDGNTDAIDRAVAAGERKAFSDDQTRASLGLLVQRTKDLDTAMQLNAAAMDLARQRNIPLSQASEALGLAFEGNVGKLNRMGLGLEKGADLTTILAAVQGQAGGAAEAYAGTQQAAGERAANAWANFQEDVGGVVNQVAGAVLPVLMDAMTQVLAVVTEVVQGMTPIIQEIITVVRPVIEQVVAEISKFWTEIQPGVMAAMAVIQQIMQTAWPYIAQIIQGAWTIISGIVQTAWAIVSGIIQTGMALLSGDWEGAWNAIQNMFAGVWAGIQTILGGAWQAVQGIVTNGLSVLRGLWDSGWGAIRDALMGVWNFITQEIPRKLGEIWSAISSWLSAAPGNIITAVARWVTAFFRFTVEILTSLPGRLRAVWEAITGWIGTTASNIFTEAIRIGSRILDGIMDGLRGAAQAIGEFLMGVARTVWENIVNFFTGGANAQNQQNQNQGGGGADSIRNPGEFGRDTIGQLGPGFGIAGAGGGGISITIGTLVLHGAGDRVQQGRDVIRGMSEELQLQHGLTHFGGRRP